MRVVLQKVKKASVEIAGEKVAKINKGAVVLVGIKDTDDEKIFKYIGEKIINLRIFEDENDKLNLSIKDLKYEILIVPNFTIYADARQGRRPSFSSGASPKIARDIFENFIKYMKNIYEKIDTGIFQANMQVEIVNDGPVTIIIDSDKIL